MVLTNYEMWAADTTAVPDAARLEFERTMARSRQLNPFNPVQHHLSSNGYYGYSYIVSAHEMPINNNIDNNNNNNNDNNNNYSDNNSNNNENHNNNNNNNLNNIQAGMEGTRIGTGTGTNDTNDQNNVNGDFVYNNAFEISKTNDTNVNTCDTQKRNKKRQLIMNYGSNNDHSAAINHQHHHNRHTNSYNLNINNNDVSSAKYAKRCRYDDNCFDYCKDHHDFSAEYCNDFFNLPSNQISIQSCFMDTEDNLSSHQASSAAAADDAATQLWNCYNHNNSDSSDGCIGSHNNNYNNNIYENVQQQQLSPPPPPPQQQQEQHDFYDVNRDVSRCMSSHMI